MATYNSSHTGAQIDAAVTFGMSPDAVPTSGSQKGVRSGGVYNALAGKQDSLTFDSSPSSGSTNPVTSGGLFDALAAKAPISSPAFTGAPTAPTQVSTDNSMAIATTAFVQSVAGILTQNLADPYDAAHGYSVNDMVIRGNLLYKYVSDNRMIYRTSDNNLYRGPGGNVYRVNQSSWGNNSVSQTTLANEVTALMNRVPPAPTTDGTYTLQATVSGGVVTYAWV